MKIILLIVMNVQVARDADLLEQIGKDIFFDLVDHDKVRSFRIQKQMTFNLFKVFLNFFFLVLMTCGLCSIHVVLIVEWSAGGGCQRVWYTCSISTVLDMGKETEPHIPSQSPFNSTGGDTIGI